MSAAFFGRVVDRTGAGRAARLSVFDQFGNIATLLNQAGNELLADASGHFYFETSTVGTYLLRIELGGAVEEMTVQAQLTTTGTEFATLQGNVKNYNQQYTSVKGVRVYLAGTDTPASIGGYIGNQLPVDRDGNFSIYIEKGQYDLVFVDKSGQTSDRVRVVNPDLTLDVCIQVDDIGCALIDMNGCALQRILQPPPDDPEALWYKLDETSGSTANDSGPFDLDMSLSSAVWDGGLKCNGGTSCGGQVTVDADYRDPPLTMCCWTTPILRSDWVASGYSFVPYPPHTISNDIPGSGGFGFGLAVWSNSGGGSCLIVGGSLPYQLYTPRFYAGTQYHIAVVYEPSGYSTVYVNGSPIDTRFVGDVANGASSTLYLAKHNNDAGYGSRRFHSGTLRDARIYKRALTPEELAAIVVAGPQ